TPAVSKSHASPDRCSVPQHGPCGAGLKSVRVFYNLCEERVCMSVLVQQPAPEFKAQAVMPNGSFQEVSLADYQGKYVLLFFYPLDFTFVCPTEIIAFSDAAEQFRELNVHILGCSIDSHFSHLAWRNTPRSQGGIGKVDYPLIADLKKE